MNNLTPKCFLFPYVRFFNAVARGNGFDFYRCNTLSAAGIPFGAFSSYLKSETGQQIFKITKSGNKNEVLAQIAINFNVGDVYTLSALEGPGGISLFAINEPTQKSNLQYGHIRICNLSRQCKCVDAYAGNECIAADIHYLDVSKYLAVVPDKYTLKIKSSDNSEDFLTCPSQIVKPGKYNSLYIIGEKSESSEPSGIFTIDAASYNGFYL